MSTIGKAASFNRKTNDTDPHDLSMSKGGKAPKGLSLQVRAGRLLGLRAAVKPLLISPFTTGAIKNSPEIFATLEERRR
eukprot:9487719-Pyramimonas_sp.AAC.1